MGRIYAVKRFEIHDGDGIRTTLFLKGCPLRCKWCHNPEGLSSHPEIGYFAGRCIGCSTCTTLCDAHFMNESGHHFDRAKCSGCGRCATACLGGALTFYGEEVTAQQILPKLLEDVDFYRASGGGVTLSGGEPMMQPEFVRDVLRLLKKNGIHTALDTCGYAPWEAYAMVLPWVDLLLFDIKAVDDEMHTALTGCSNRLILQNLRQLDELSKPIDVRIPYVPGMNDGQIPQIGALLKELRSLRGVKVLPYHNYASAKYAALGMEYPIPDIVPPESQSILAAVRHLRALGINATDQTGDAPLE